MKIYGVEGADGGNASENSGTFFDQENLLLLQKRVEFALQAKMVTTFSTLRTSIDV